MRNFCQDACNAADEEELSDHCRGRGCGSIQETASFKQGRQMRSRGWGCFVGLLLEEGQRQGEEQSQISGDEVQWKDYKEYQGLAVHFH
jgi:hypothetical protein